MAEDAWKGIERWLRVCSAVECYSEIVIHRYETTSDSEGRGIVVWFSFYSLAYTSVDTMIPSMGTCLVCSCSRLWDTCRYSFTKQSLSRVKVIFGYIQKLWKPPCQTMCCTTKWASHFKAECAQNGSRSHKTKQKPSCLYFYLLIFFMFLFFYAYIL